MSKKVIIIGGGFGGLTAAKTLKNVDVEITLIDKTNHHLFQPLPIKLPLLRSLPGILPHRYEEYCASKGMCE